LKEQKTTRWTALSKNGAPRNIKAGMTLEIRNIPYNIQYVKPHVETLFPARKRPPLRRETSATCLDEKLANSTISSRRRRLPACTDTEKRTGNDTNALARSKNARNVQTMQPHSEPHKTHPHAITAAAGPPNLT